MKYLTTYERFGVVESLYELADKVMKGFESGVKEHTIETNYKGKDITIF